MSMKVPAILADAGIGVLVSGVIVGGLVPALGTSVGPATALGVGLAAIIGAVFVGRALRRSRSTGSG